MEWQIDGADADSGEARRVKVAGKTRDEAERRARAFGILVSTCEPILGSEEVGTEQYRPPYKQLKSDASAVRAWAVVLWILGAVSVVGGALLLAAVFFAKDGDYVELVIPAVVSVFNGGALLAGAALMSLLASMGDALRDIARKD